MALADDTSALADFAITRRNLSPERRMNEVHSERRTSPATDPFQARRAQYERPGPDDDNALKAARAEAVEFVVKAFAAIDKNLALADKARLQHEANRAATEKMRLDAEEDLTAARRMREEAARELADARVRSEELISGARSRSNQLLEASQQRCRAQAESARRRLAESLAPLRHLVGQAGATIDAFVDCAAGAGTAAEEAIDIRDDAGEEIRWRGEGGGARLQVVVTSPVQGE